MIARVLISICPTFAGSLHDQTNLVNEFHYDVSGGSSRDEFAVDNIQISAAAVPEPASLFIWTMLDIAVGLGALRFRR